MHRQPDCITLRSIHKGRFVVKTPRMISLCTTVAILATAGMVFSIIDVHHVYAGHPAKGLAPLPGIDTYRISGNVLDVAAGTPIHNSRITLLNCDTRNVLCTDIYTDDNGHYDETLNIDVTDVDHDYSELPPARYSIENYPNPLSAAPTSSLTIQYRVAADRPETPTVEMYDILGRKITLGSHLPAGVYVFRLRFSNDHLTDAKKIVLLTGGRLTISLTQMFEESTQHTGKIDAITTVSSDSLEVLFVIEKSGYASIERTRTLLKGVNNVNNFTLVKAGETASAAVDSTGGRITVMNTRGDTISLTIPRYAIWQSTMITLTALTTQPQNPIGHNIFPGVSVTPAGLMLLQPAALTVSVATGILDTNAAALFAIRQSDFVLPIGRQTVSERTMYGELYHFSDIIGGAPTGDEATPQAGKAGDMKPSDPYGWEDTHDCVDALLWWAEFLTRSGRTEEGQECFDKAKEIVERDAGDFLGLPMPDDPCGEYLTALLKFAELVCLVVGGDLERQIQDRVIEVVNRCNLRGEIDYDHHLLCADVERYTDTKIVGSIPFYVNTLVEPNAAISGGGAASVTITGTQEECSLSGSGVHRVHNISGEMKADQQGVYWLEMTLDETWYESTVLYVTCPDPDNSGQAVMPSFRFPTQIRMLVEDGWRLAMPDSDCDGRYQWTLRIVHQP